MANSKANIYPVQLQGAELNLNKYDAEIKQYSGFNKNNAPFVGGCLSNLFTKDETIEGATSKNTYIAPNGDIYRVTTEGLFKNEEKLIDYTGKKFYTVEECEIQFPNNTFYVDDEKCYITSQYNKTLQYIKYDYTLHVYNEFADTWENVAIDLVQPINGAGRSFIAFDVRKYKIENTMLIFVAYKTFTAARLNVYKVTESGVINVSNNLVRNVTSFTSAIAPVILHLEKVDENGGIVSVIPNTYFIASNNYAIVNYTFNNNGEITLSNNIASDFIFSASKMYKRVLDSNAEEVVSYDYIIHNGTLVTENPQTVNWGNNYTKYVTTRDGFGSNVLKNFGFITWLKKFNDDSTRYDCVGICDYLSSALTFGKNSDNYEILNFYTGAVVGDYVLYNNAIASGICLPGGMILVSEWNSVDDDYIFVQTTKRKYTGVHINGNCDVIYKTNGKWVELKESTPSIKVINNQLVCNVNDIYNSLRLTDNKKLLFAPAWNNRFPAKRNNSNFAVNPSPLNPYYIASSINEYALEDNSSIIINPIACIISLDDYSDNTLFDDIIDICVNFYRGYASEAEIKYSHSAVLSSITGSSNDVYSLGVLFEKLMNLPFPSNTDGNIQYSPSLFATEKGKYGNLLFISEGGTVYKLMTYNNKAIMSYFLSTAIEGLQDFFTIQGQLYGILGNQIYNFSITNEVANRGDFVVSIEGLQFCGNTPYEALFYSKTNRCLYSFTGANVLNAKQFVDKISEVRDYKYNPATQSIFLMTDIGVLVYSLFGIYQIDFVNCKYMYLLNNGVILTDNEGTFRYIKYYKEECLNCGYTKESIQLETMFYGINDQTVSVNDCLYVRLFSEEHESGDVIVSATTLKTEGRTTENTTFVINASDWDAETHTYYLRYQPQEQRGVGISFKINSPFKIASLAIGTTPDSILLDKGSKYAINTPNVISSNARW